jgi:hypothetical protein
MHTNIHTYIHVRASERVLKLKQKKNLLIETFQSNEIFVVVKDESFIFKTLLLLIYATKIFAIYHIKF